MSNFNMEYYMLHVKSRKKFEFKFHCEHHFAFKPIRFLYNSMKLLWRCSGF
jgi:hypothetical protein